MITSNKQENGARYQRFCCIGKSMFPTIQPGDDIFVEPRLFSEIGKGDVVVFTPHQNAHNVVHRVISKDTMSALAQGDNTREPDNCLIEEKNLVGKVSLIRRNGHLRRIHGGSSGLRYRQFIVFRKQMRTMFGPCVIVILRLIARLPYTKRIFCQLGKPTVMRLPRSDDELMLLVRGKVAGIQKDNAEWKIRRLYEPFIDTTALPLNSAAKEFPVYPAC